MSFEYKIKGARHLRKYTAPILSPSTAAGSDAAAIPARICDLPWELTDEEYPSFPVYAADKADENEAARDCFDAAAWCANHDESKRHRVFANACFYRFSIPESVRGATCAAVRLTVTCDPYTPQGARVSVATTESDDLPTSCAECRTGDVHSDGVAPRTSSEENGKTYWYERTETVTLDFARPLGRYLIVFIGLEDYRARNGWIEGAARLDAADLVFDTSVEGLEGDAVNDLRGGDTVDTTPTTHDIAGAIKFISYGTSGAAETKSPMSTGPIVSRLEDRGLMPLRHNGFVHTIHLAAASFADRVAGQSGYTWPTALLNTKVFRPGTEALINVASDYSSNALSAGVPGGILSLIKSRAEQVLIFPAAPYVRSGNPSTYGVVLSFIPTFQGGLTLSRKVNYATTDIDGLFPPGPASNVAIGFLGRQSTGYSFSGNIEFASNRLEGDLSGYRLSRDGYFDRTFWSAGHLVCLAIGRSEITAVDPTEKIDEVQSLAFASASSVCPSIGYEGTITDISPDYSDPGRVGIIVSGRLSSVGGRACKNCAIVHLDMRGGMSVEIPAFDAAATPDDYTDYQVRPTVPYLQSTDYMYSNVKYDDTLTYVVSGRFTRLSGLPMVGCASVRLGSRRPEANIATGGSYAAVIAAQNGKFHVAEGPYRS